MKISPVVACLILACSGCGHETEAVAVKATVPVSLLSDCNLPVAIPDRELSGAEVELSWGRDRSSLGSCARGKAALVTFIEENYNVQ